MVKKMFFDIHSHVYKYQYPSGGGQMLFIDPEQLKETHAKMNITRAALLPIVHPEVYIPQSVGEIIDFANESNGQWIPFCNIDPRALSNSSNSPMGILLDHYMKLGCKGIGEFMPNMPWKDPRVLNLLGHVEKAGIPLLFDMTGRLDSGYGIYDEPGMPQLEYCLNKFKDLIFIGHGPSFWAEISELKNPGDHLTYPTYKVYKEGRVPQLMREYPNLWVDLSAGSGSNAMMRDPEYAVSFLNEFHDRTMFGTDICYYQQGFNLCEFIIGLRDNNSISEEIFQKIAHLNAERLLKL